MGAPITDFKDENYTREFLKETYTQTFHDNHYNIFRPRNLNAARVIHESINFSSVVDFGCSIGTYLEHFMLKGCEVKGFEFCYEECLSSIKKVPRLENFIEFGDVTTPIKLEKKYDLAMSIEVAEHIPTSKSDVLVRNLCNASKRSILFTAAGIGQGGTGHINCQEKNFWIEKFESEGWSQDHEVERDIKSRMISRYENDGRNEFPIVWSFVYENLMCFKAC